MFLCVFVVPMKKGRGGSLNARGEKQQDVPIENQQPIVTTRPFLLAKLFFAIGNGRVVTID